jgi:hypothetical protein
MQDGSLQRMATSLEALNVRIARLAIGLGVSLQSDDEMARLMSRPALVATVPERRSLSERRTSEHAGAGPERRVAHQWEELRGLLVMRYSVETRCVDEVGVEATQQIMALAEVHLERDGFKPGADGIKLERLFKDPS